MRRKKRDRAYLRVGVGGVWWGGCYKEKNEEREIINVWGIRF